MKAYQSRKSDFAIRLARACADTHVALGLDEEVRLESIGRQADDAYQATWEKPEGWLVDWPCSRALEQRKQKPACFNLAIWHRDTLCGLSIGEAVAKRFVGIDLIEGNPDHRHPLKGMIIPITLIAAEFYRIQLPAWELRLYDVTPGLIDMYQQMGFELAPDLGGP